MGLLTGIRVLEVATVISGPYAAWCYRTTEPKSRSRATGGDPFRYWAEPRRTAAVFDSLNRGKKSGRAEPQIG